MNRTDHPCFQVQVLWEGLQDEVSKSALSQAQLLSGHCAQQCLPCILCASQGEQRTTSGHTALLCCALLLPSTCHLLWRVPAL